MKKGYFLLLGLILLGACKDNKLKPFERLNGTWVETGPTGTTVEKWETTNDTLMSGFTYMLQGTDTAYSEKIQLFSSGKDFYYAATVSNQNDGKPVRFRMTSKKEKVWVFENKKHKFPQKIIYTFKGKDSLIATIEGKQDEKFQRFSFRFKKQ